jgi:hypothetical protein
MDVFAAVGYFTAVSLFFAVLAVALPWPDDGQGNSDE